MENDYPDQAEGEPTFHVGALGKLASTIRKQSLREQISFRIGCLKLEQKKLEEFIELLDRNSELEKVLNLARELGLR